MNKIVILVILIALGLGGYFLLGDSGEKMEASPTNQAMIADDSHAGDEVMKDDEISGDEKMMESEEKGGSYVDYDEKKFAADSSKRRIYFFHASWCPTCKVADKNLLSRVGDLPSDVVVYKTDYDNEKELTEKYAVTYQHTFVQVDEDGNEVMKWNGGDVDELLSRII